LAGVIVVLARRSTQELVDTRDLKEAKALLEELAG
jgi:hypothetical protein